MSPLLTTSATATALRALIGERFPDAIPVSEAQARRAGPVPVGIEGLERAFPAGGLPRGRLTAWLSQGGATAVLRASCHATIAAGERAVWIDGAGILGPDWASGAEGPVIVRSTSRLHALRWAEGLLHSGGFALVILVGAEPQGREPVRLVRAAHEGGGACVVLTTLAAMAALRVTSRVLPSGYHCLPGPFADPAAIAAATIEVRVRALGWNERAHTVLPVAPYDIRLSLDTSRPDRRGVAR